MELINNKFKNFRIILASASPRRQSLLKESGLIFEMVENTIDNNEDFPENMNICEVASYLAHKKSGSILITDKNQIIITADTVVGIGQNILGKPKDFKEAENMLKTLSGKTHFVNTGVCIRSEKKTKVFDVVTNVSFRELNNEEIHYYIEKFKPYDKAGAYGIQEWIGIIGIEKIEGCYYNVVGLPVERLYHELLEF